MNPKKESPAANRASKSIYKNHSKRQPTQTQQDSFSAVNALALAALPTILKRWLPDGILRGIEYKARNPKRDDRRVGSFSINIRTGRWADFATGDRGGDVISLAAYLFSLNQNEAKNRIAEMLGVKP